MSLGGFIRSRTDGARSGRVGAYVDRSVTFLSFCSGPEGEAVWTDEDQPEVVLASPKAPCARVTLSVRLVSLGATRVSRLFSTHYARKAHVY